MNIRLTILLALFSSMVNAQWLPSAIPIWPDSIGPGSANLQIKETITERIPTGNCTADRIVEKVTMPVLYPFVSDKPNGTCIILCPGGGYQRLAIDIEGTSVAKWLNEMGITAFLLTYRLPLDGHLNKEHVPLQDAQRAIRYLRRHASRWNIDTSKIGILGASAGGHVASSLSTGFNKQVYSHIDEIDKISARPDFQILLYPVISMDSTIAHKGSRSRLVGDHPSAQKIEEFSTDKQVTSVTPPTFIAVAKDDAAVRPANSQRFYDSLVAHQVKSKLYMYENGGHGVGICKAVGKDFAKWTDDCKAWLLENKWTSK